MAKRVRALVRHDVLTWARESAGYAVEEAAKKLQVKPERLASWERESDENRPTINQLRKMATVYKRPLSVFYLQEVPKTFQVLRDFRRLPGDGLRRYSPELISEMRFAQQRRELALDLISELDETPIPFPLSTSLGADPEALATTIRRQLKISYPLQVKWRDPRIAFNTWRAHMEALGVLVFQMDRVPPDEVSGFAISEEILPVIAINRKKTPFSRRSFSLLHEFAHLMLRQSGVSDLDVDASRPPEDQRVEVFCNQVAAAALMPRERFLSEDRLQSRSGRSEWGDDEIEEMANVYSVSREAVVRRLLTFNRTSESFYRRKRAQYKAEREARRAREKAKFQEQEYRRNPPRDAVSNFGKPFIRLVLNNYYQDRITLSDVSSYLGLRVRHVPKIEQTVGLG
jgi:Zn-dependent peptidase ImmA (M78 family)/DNA-binding XRE family transcriptional regulator